MLQSNSLWSNFSLYPPVCGVLVETKLQVFCFQYLFQFYVLKNWMLKTPLYYYLANMFFATYCLSAIFFLPESLPRPRYWTYLDATWYRQSLGAIVYFYILVTLKGQGHSIKFKVKLKKFSKCFEKSLERFWRHKYAYFAHDFHLITQGHT